MRIVPYLAIATLAAIFCGWSWNLGTMQGPVGSIEEVPSIFNISSIIASVLFFGSAWLVLSKNLKNSFFVLAGISSWYVAVVILGRLEFFAARPLFAPNIAFAFIVLAISIRKLTSLPSLRTAFEKTSLDKIFLVQTFRVMGVVFLTLYAMKVLPGEFAISTGVGDIFIGLTAPFVAYIYFLQKPFSKPIAVLWNWVGIADLALSISLGILTYPEPLEVITTRVSNAPIALYPLVIIPVFAVPFSLLLHLLSLNALKKR